MKLNRRTALTLSFATLLMATYGCKPQHHRRTSVEIEEPDATSIMQQDVQAGAMQELRWPEFPDYKQHLNDFYALREWEPAWSVNGKPTRQAMDMIRNFQHASERGLIPEDYDAWKWPARIAAVRHKKAADIANFDVAMSIISMRFVSDLHIGRVNPQRFSFGVNVDQKKYDLPQFLNEKLVDTDSVDDALSAAEPQAPEYVATKQALAQYVSLLPQDIAGTIPVVTGKPIAPGEHYSGSQALAQRLALFGYIPNVPETVDPVRYDGQLVDGVKQFQECHGLAIDGKLGKDTVAAINVPLGVRINQLMDALERWRWLSDEFQNAGIIVNLPEFKLRAFSENHHEDFNMRVVIGQSVPEHRTPVITDRMKYLVFRPYWNVPPSIMKAEIAPHMRANPNYLESHNFEAVDAKGKPVVATWEKVAHANVIVREKPGPRNSLGLVKFLFPNQFNVYLHSTPATELFSRTKRDFSHGCVRLQEPEKLAEWVLRDQPKWTEDAIHDAMESGQDNKTVLLTHPLPIVLFYATAYPSEDGLIHFFSDTYGYDKMLEDTLHHGPPYPQKPMVQKVTAEE